MTVEHIRVMLAGEHRLRNNKTEQQEKPFKGRVGCFEMQVQKEEFEPLLLCICLKLGVRGCTFPQGVTHHEPISDHLPSLNMIQFECTNAEGVADRRKVDKDVNCLPVQQLITSLEKESFISIFA